MRSRSVAPVAHQEQVGLGDVVVDAAAGGQAGGAFPGARRPVDRIGRRDHVGRADTGVVVEHAMRRGMALEMLVEQQHVGVVQTGRQGVVGAVAADHQVAPGARPLPSAQQHLVDLRREAGRDLAVAAEVGMDLVDPVVAVAAFGRVGPHQGVAGVDDVERRQRLAAAPLSESSSSKASASPSVSRSAMRCCSAISRPEPANALNSHGPAIGTGRRSAPAALRGVA